MRKNFKIDDGDIFSAFSGTPAEVEEVEEARKQEKPKKAAKKKIVYERLNLSIPKDLKDYLKVAAFKVSSPDHIVSLTQYLCKLIEEDRERNK